MRVIWVIAVLTGILRAASPPTFYKDVPPVLERNCLSCDRVGAAAPKPLVTCFATFDGSANVPANSDPAVGAHLYPMDVCRSARKRAE